MKSPNIVFFGSSQLSLEALESLSQDVAIEAVVTRPQRSTGSKVVPTPPQAWALGQGVAVFAPASSAELNQLVKQQHFTAALGVLVDYGLLLPPSMIKSFAKGIVNSHFSLLPQWRGADPMRSALLSGQPRSGVSLMLIDEQLDHGPLLAQADLKIKRGEDINSLKTRLSRLNQQLLAKTLPLYLAGRLQPSHQNHSEATYSRKLTKADGQIDWSQPATQIERQIRAYQGWPGSQTTLEEQPVVIIQAHVAAGQGQPGQLVDDNSQLAAYTGNGVLVIDRLKPSGRAEMSGRDFLNGLRRGPG